MKKVFLLTIMVIFVLGLTTMTMAQCPTSSCSDCPSTTSCGSEVSTDTAVKTESKAKWYAGHKHEAYLKVLDPMVDNAMEGYNKEDFKMYYKDLPKAMAAIGTEIGFKSVVLNMYKKKTGNLKSKTFLSKSVFNKPAPLVYYEGDFEKGKFPIAVNFQLQTDGTYKIMQITIQ